MKYLLDTHVALWLFEGNHALGKKTKDIIIKSADSIGVSYISVWGNNN